MPATTARDPAEAALRREEARAAAAGVAALLATPPLQHHLGLMALARIVTDLTAPQRERRRAAETLVRVEVQLQALQVSLTGARELALADMGVDAATLRGLASVNIDARTQIVSMADLVRSCSGLESRRPASIVSDATAISPLFPTLSQEPGTRRGPEATDAGDREPGGARLASDTG